MRVRNIRFEWPRDELELVAEVALGTQPLSVQLIGNSLVVWVLEDENEPARIPCRFIVVNNYQIMESQGLAMTEGEPNYIGTFTVPYADSKYLSRIISWHVFKVPDYAGETIDLDLNIVEPRRRHG